MVFHNELEEQFHKQAIQLLLEAFYNKFNYLFSKEKDFRKFLKLLINKRKVIYFLENDKILGILLYSNNYLKFNMNFKSLVQEFGFLKAIFIIMHESPFHNKLDNNETCIDFICVNPEARGRKIATLLMDEMTSFAIESKHQYLSLLVVENNVAAQKLYEKINFKITKVISIKFFSKIFKWNFKTMFEMKKQLWN